MHHGKDMCLLLKTNNFDFWDKKWLMLYIRRDDKNDSGPESYIININYPIRSVYDGALTNNIFIKGVGWECFWHEYEEFILNWKNYLKGVKPILNQTEVSLCIWEMFVYSNDRWFAKNGLSELLFNSLDEEKSLGDRFDHYCNLLFFLERKYPDAIASIDQFKSDLSYKMKNYAYWLGIILDQ